MPATSRVSDADVDDAIRRYIAGEGRLLTIARSINVGVPRFKREMLARGVQWKTPADTLAERQRRMRTDPVWQQRLADARQRTAETWGRSEANRERMRQLGRSRGGRSDAPSKASTLDARSLSHQRQLLKVSPSAVQLRDWLVERGQAPVMEQACGRYNLDIAIGPVAVEVHRYALHPLGDTTSAIRLRQRARYICDRGWLLAYVWISARSFLLLHEAADYLVSLVEQAKCDPSLVGQYRVIRGTGEFVAQGRLDRDE